MHRIDDTEVSEHGEQAVTMTEPDTSNIGPT